MARATRVQLFLITVMFGGLFSHQSFPQSLNSNTPDSQRIEDYQEKSTAGSSQAAWRVIITNSPDKKGKEVGDTTIFVNRELKLYANLYDDKGQYKRKISVSWFWADIQSPTETGNDSIKFLGTGSSLSFKPTELDTGFIYVWASFFYQNDSTGIITIIAGQLSKLVIRDKSGRSVENVAMTTDQEIQLFAAGYDSTNYYLGNQMVTWSSRGLIPEVQLEDSVLIFSPTRPGSGKIYAFVHKILTPYPIGDSTGIITVHPGVPTGDIMLTPDPPVISADGISISKITSDPIHDAKGNTVAPKTFITVTTDFGTIISTDENITIPGIQVTTNSSGIISLELRSAKQPGIATVQATSVEGNARGQTFVTFGKEELLLLSTYSDRTEITQGQENISVSVIVKNIGLIPSFIKEVSLELFAPDSQSVTAQYQITRIDTITQILSGQTGEFNFSVNANPYADTVLVSVDGKLTTQDGVYTHFAQKHQWQVQSPPRLHILSISTLAEEVFQGQDSLVVWMQVANQGMASVNTIDARLTFWHGGQNVTADYEVRMSETNPQIIAGHRSANLTLIVRVKPLATLGAIVINGKISARDVNTGKSYSDEGADVPASWMVTLTSAEVVITSTSINCPNVNQEGDGEVNIHQPYSVEVTIRNIGGEEVKNVGVTLISSGTSIFQSDTSRVITWIPRRESHQITFELLAYSAALPALERFTARIDSATASLSGRQATIAPSLDSEARVAIRMPANLTLKLENTFLQLTLGQRFYVKAYVYNAPENARYDSSGILGIILPEGYELISSNPTQNFKENEEVCWTVRAPLVAQGPDSILVYLSQRPRDKNNPSEFALVTTDSVVLVVQTLESTLAITEVSVTEPPGAKDGILSTEQSFVVTGKIVKQKVENVYAQITIPDAYYNSDNDLQYLGADTVVTWRLKAPNSPDHRPKNIVIKAWGNQEQDTTRVYSTPDSSLSISTVGKANLKVAAEIISPPSALQGQISPGSEFQIKGEILNLGEAGIYGNKSLLLDPQDPNSFTVLGDRLLPVIDNFVVWTIRASDSLDHQIKIIKIKLQDIPNDENTNSPAHIDEDNKTAEIAVSTARGVGRLELMVRKLTDVAPVTIAPGETDLMMALECTNLATQSGVTIKLNSLKFDIEDRNGNLISPFSVISGFRVRDNKSLLGQATTISQNPVEIPFTPPRALLAQETDTLYLEADFQENLSQPFQINLKDSSYIHAVSQIDVFIVNESGKSIWNLRSNCPVITEKELKKSFVNYPNPFGRTGQEKTRFVYYLSQDADIQLTIYTLLGELVWQCSYPANQPQGKKGLHQGDEITWDGENSRGQKVLNGVYLAKIQTSYGDWAITKVAVLK